MNDLEHILKYQIVAIIRGLPTEHMVPVVQALYSGGIRNVEITLNTSGALDAIKNLSQEMSGKMLVGAGTVLTAIEAEAAINAGAKFIISPIVDVDTIKVTKQLGAVSIPGAYTATEVVLASNSGADIVKIFPASGGAAYIKNLKGPLPHIRMMPTGGVDLDTIAAFKKAGAEAFGIGSALVSANQQITTEALHQLADKARRFVEVCGGTGDGM